MSATLGALLRLMEPDWSITPVGSSAPRRRSAMESSDPWNNAGTGRRPSLPGYLNCCAAGRAAPVEIAKAVNVNEQFQVTRQFWSSPVEHGITDARSFYQPGAACQLVQGAENVDYLRRRRRNPGAQPVVRVHGVHRRRRRVPPRRLPLMAGRDFSSRVGLNWTDSGTDVDFGSPVVNCSHSAPPAG